MFKDISWLALETKYLDRAVAFYEAFLSLETQERTESAAVLAAGETDLILRAPGSVPRGGLHTHYALSVPAGEYDDWHDRLADRFDLVEHEFDTGRSLYFYDPDGNCVELGTAGVEGSGIEGIFKVALEVTDLDRALACYRALGAEPTDRQERRVRLSAGPFELELWEPQLGRADARGGVHVGLGVETTDPDPEAVVASLPADASVERREDGTVSVRDPDGHALTLR